MPCQPVAKRENGLLRTGNTPESAQTTPWQIGWIYSSALDQAATREGDAKFIKVPTALGGLPAQSFLKFGVA